MLLFFLFGPMLTLGLVAGIGVRKLPSNTKAFERSIAVRTGLETEIESVEFRTPTAFRLRNVRLTDKRSQIPVFQAPVADLTFVSTEALGAVFLGLQPAPQTDDEKAPSLNSFVEFFSHAFAVQLPNSGFWRLSIPQAKLRFESLTAEESASKTKNILFELLARYGSASKYPFQIVLDEVEFRTPHTEKRPDKRPDEIRFLTGNLYRVDNETRFDWTFKLPEVSETETHRVAMVQRSLPLGNDYEFHLITGCPLPNQTISCEFAATFCPMFALFGDGSRFSGEFHALYRSADAANPWTIQLTNVFFRNLNVARFAAEYTPYRVDGTVKGLQINSATFSEKTFGASGWMEVVAGNIEQTLMRRLVDRFGVSVQPASELESPTIPFSQCVVFFQLEKDGARFWVNNSDSLLMVRGEFPKYEMKVGIPPRIGQISYHEMLSAFAPDVAPVVPLTTGTRKILSVLPTEPTAPRKPATAAPLTANPWGQ